MLKVDQNKLQRRIAIAATYVLVVILLDWASSFFLLQTGIAICYPPAGLFLAVILLLGWRALPLAFLSPFFSMLLVFGDPSIPFAASVAIGAVSMISPALILFAVNGKVRTKRLFGSLRRIILFVLLVVFAVSVESPVAAYAYIATGVAAPGDFFALTIGWWISLLLPYLTLTPLVLLSVAAVKGEMATPRRWGWSLLVVLVTAPLFTWMAMSGAESTGNSRLYLCVLPILFGVLVGGLQVSTLAAFMVTAAALVLAPSTLSSAGLVQELQFFLLILAITALVTGGIEADRQRMYDARIRRRIEGQRLDRGLLQLLPTVFTDQATAARRLTKVVAQALNVCCASVWRLNQTDERLECVALFRGGQQDCPAAQDSERYADLFADLKRRGTITINDAVTALDSFKWRGLDPLAQGRGGLLLAPVQSSDTVIGVVVYEHEGAHLWTRNEVGFAERTAQQMVTAFLAEDLRESEARYQEVAHSLPGVTYQFYVRPENEYGLTFISPRAKEIFGLDVSGRRGYETFVSSLHPDDRDAVLASFSASVASCETWEVEGRLLHPETREPKWFRVLATPMIRPGEIVFNGVVLDVTAQKEAELEQTRLAAAIEQAAEDVVVTDLDATIQYVNPAFERVTGYSRSEVVGKNPKLLKSGVHDAFFYQELWDTLTNGEAWHGRIVNRHKDGHLIYQDASITPIFDPGGRLVGYVAVKRDVTEQIKLEARVAQSNKMEAIGNLAGGIAHDFNNILTAILGFVELALLEAGDNTTLADDLQHVFDASIRAKELVSQILTFSRHNTESPALLSVGDVATQTLTLMRASLPSTIEIVYDDTSTVLVMADRVRVHQIVMNLCTNAGQAMRADGGTLTVEVRDARVESSEATELGLSAGDYVELCVSDTGPGMTEEVAARVFEPFFTTKPVGEGTGMGLAVVHGIVHKGGGTITATSEPGEGTMFRVLLPVAAQQELSLQTERSKALRGDERVMFVDDEPLIRAVAVRSLERRGYQVDAFETGDEALKVFAAAPSSYDVVVTDMTMPGLTGDMLTRELLGLRADLPIIICTGYSDRIDAVSARTLGARMLLPKPIHGHTLAESIRTTLDE